MAGFNRRAKPLKAGTSLADITGLSITNPSDGDLLVYDSATGIWVNAHALRGVYTLVGSLSLTTLAVSGNATVTGTLGVTGAVTLGSSLSVTGNATISGTTSVQALTVAGLLTGAGFSFSGNGTVAGNLSVSGTLAVTVGMTLAGSLVVSGNITGTNLFLSGLATIGAGLTVVGSGSFGGNLSAGTLSVSGNASIGGTITLGAGALYSDRSIVFLDDKVTPATLYMGSQNVLSLRTASIVEGAGLPTAASANGSLYLRTDGDMRSTLYYRNLSQWTPLTDNTGDVDFLLNDYFERQEYLAVPMLTADSAAFGAISVSSTTISADRAVFTFAGAERARINAKGQIVSMTTGTSAGTAPAYVDPPDFAGVIIPGIVAQSNFTALCLDTYSDVGVSQNSHFAFRRSRSNQMGGYGQVISGDRVGSISYQASNATTFNYSAQINSYIDGTPAGDTPGRLELNTTRVGANSPSLALRIDSAGLISAQASSKFGVIDSFGVGAQTATFVAANKPGVATTAPTQWLTINLNGTDYYIPCFL